MIEESQPETVSLEQALNAERIFKHTLLESLRIGVCRVDASGCVCSLNLEGARIFGRTEQDCLGQSLHALIGCRLPDSTTDQDDCPVPHVIKAGKTIWVPKSLIRRRSGGNLVGRVSMHPNSRSRQSRSAVSVSGLK